MEELPTRYDTGTDELYVLLLGLTLTVALVTLIVMLRFMVMGA